MSLLFTVISLRPKIQKAFNTVEQMNEWMDVDAIKQKKQM